MRPRLVIDILAVLSGMAILAFGWSTQVENRRLKGNLREAVSSIPLPYVVSGLHVDIMHESDLISQSNSSSNVGSERTLVFVSRDDCQACKKQIANWLNLLSGADRKSTAAWVITLDSGTIDRPLIEKLRSSGFSYQFRRARGVPAFVLHTGISAIPTTLLLGTDMQVKLIHSGVLEPATLNVFRQSLAAVQPNVSRSELNGQFLRRGKMELLSAKVAQASH